MLSKASSSIIFFWVFGTTTRPGIEPLFPRPLADTTHEVNSNMTNFKGISIRLELFYAECKKKKKKKKKIKYIIYFFLITFV